MYLLEHDAKLILAAAGIPIPAGTLHEHAGEPAPGTLPPAPWIVKGQITAGGRGKAGIIRRADTVQEVAACLKDMLGASVRSHRVNAVRVEHRIAAATEAYVSLLLDPAAGGVRIVMSDRGGVDVEALPREALHMAVAQPTTAALSACAARLGDAVGGRVGAALRAAAQRLARVFIDCEASLIEINPLFVLPDGNWIAGDAKLMTDDNALPRQHTLRALLQARAATYADVARKEQHGFDYIVVDPEGEIGLLTTGAGLSMMLIDEMRAAGLRPYNFLDIRTGGLRGETRKIEQVLAWLAQGPRVRVLLVNIFAGITDLGEFARLLVAALAAVPALKVPVVARLVGNGLPAARAILDEAHIPLCTDLDGALDAVRARLMPRAAGIRDGAPGS